MKILNKNNVIFIIALLLNLSCNAQPSSLDSVMNLLEKHDSTSYKAINETVSDLKTRKKTKNASNIIYIATHIMKQQKIIDSLKRSDNKKIQKLCSDTTAQFFKIEFLLTDAIIEQKNIEKLQLKSIYDKMIFFYETKSYYNNIPELQNKIKILESSTIISKEQKSFLMLLITKLRNDLIEVNIIANKINNIEAVTVLELNNLKEIYDTQVQKKYINDRIKELR